MLHSIHKLKYFIKITIAYVLYYSGILFLIKKIKFNNKAIVLTYHRILPYKDRYKSFSHNAIMVDTENFNRQIHFLKNNFNILSYEDFSNSLTQQKSFVNSSCLITFDDGWHDNYVNAFPILKKHDIPALIFPATNYIETNDLFWQEAMGHGFYQLFKLNDDKAKKYLDNHDLLSLENETEDTILDNIRTYVRELKSLNYAEIDAIFDQLNNILGHIKFGDIDCYLNWNEITTMSNSKIDFGSHACSHKILTRLNDQELFDELRLSKEILTKSINSEISSIAYPNGDFDERLEKYTNSAGYKVGFGTQFGAVSPYDNLLNIKRININDMCSSNLPLFMTTLLGIFDKGL